MFRPRNTNRLQSLLLRCTKPRGRQRSSDSTILLKTLSQKYILHIREVQETKYLNVLEDGLRLEEIRTREVKMQPSFRNLDMGS